jgi:hypothetical protein
MNKPNPMHFAQALDTLETRFGLRLAASLTESNQTLPHDVSERLRFAREQALLKARSLRLAQTATAPGTMLVHSGTAAALGATGQGGQSGLPRWLKLASVMPLLMLLLGLLLIHQSQLHEQILAAADVDTALLSDHLPPAAYGDPGFTEYLSDSQE